MDVFTKEEFLVNKDNYLNQIEEGVLFIYPTDTIYGVGCNALLQESVKKVRKAKMRNEMPFSILVPSKKWIYENCVVNDVAETWVEKLPGPYTLILELKKQDAVAESVNLGLDTVGVRLPSHWFTDVVRELGFPILTTSANVKGGNFMTELDDLHPRIKARMRFAVYEGPVKGKPSTLVDLTKDKTKFTER